jgi:GH24 family phage-related lysozyme (muramidase)
MTNKKVLSKAVSELNKAKAPAKPKDIITDPMGQWKYPGQNTRIPGNNITMKGVNYPVWAQPNVGAGAMMQPGQEYNFPEADYVDEFPQMKKGGAKGSKKYTRNITAMNKLFAENNLFKKPKKKQIYDPNASFYQDGGSTSFDYDDTLSTDSGLELAKSRSGNNYVVSARPYVTKDMIARAAQAGIPEDRIFATGSDKAKIAKVKELGIGNHVDNKSSVIKKLGAKGELFEEGGEYMELELSPEEIEAYREGGYVIEDISVPSLNQQKFGPGGATDLDPTTMAKYLVELKNQENANKKGYKNNKWYPHSSVEGGADTIAYGHKLTPADARYYQGITMQQAEALQQQDVLSNQAKAESIVDKKYGKGTFDSLPQDAQMLLVDYQYNVGLNKFPSFVEATVKGDKAKMIKEYERGSSAGKLTKRNNWTRGIIESLDYSKEPEPMVPVVPLANVADATVVVPQVQPVPPIAIDPLTGLQYAKGGSVTKLTQEEIDQYIEDGWIVEELD